MPALPAQVPVIALGRTQPAGLGLLQPQFPSVAVEASGLSLVTPNLGAPNRSRAGEDGVRVLLISPHTEDEALLGQILAHPKWPVWTARSLADAIRLLKQNTFSVAICESELPDGTWREFLDRAARLEHGPEVIVASLMADDFLWAEALNVGACDVLSKPFSTKEVLHVVGCAALRWESQQPVIDSPLTASQPALLGSGTAARRRAADRPAGQVSAMSSAV